jgi:hypothetical protein
MATDKLYGWGMAFCLVAFVVVFVFNTYSVIKEYNEKEILKDRILELDMEIKAWERADAAFECSEACSELTESRDRCCRESKALKEQAVQCANEKLEIKGNK